MCFGHNIFQTNQSVIFHLVHLARNQQHSTSLRDRYVVNPRPPPSPTLMSHLPLIRVWFFLWCKLRYLQRPPSSRNKKCISSTHLHKRRKIGTGLHHIHTGRWRSHFDRSVWMVCCVISWLFTALRSKGLMLYISSAEVKIFFFSCFDFSLLVFQGSVWASWSESMRPCLISTSSILASQERSSCGCWSLSSSRSSFQAW